MNRRMIEKVMAKKHKEFCASITDDRVRRLVEKNSIITGGSIVSLLLNETVNDFDYYFTDLETVHAAAEYFVNQFNELNPERAVKPYVVVQDEQVKVMVRSTGAFSEDLNFVPLDRAEQAELDKALDANGDLLKEELDGNKQAAKNKHYRPVFISENAITLSNKVQLVMRFYGDAAEIHKNYDYVHCCNYWTSVDEKLTLTPAAMESILSKHLFYQGSLYPVCSLIRMRKFMRQGWYINAGQILKMSLQVSELDLTDVKVLQEQLTGVDAAYFYMIIQDCKKNISKDPSFAITTSYLSDLIDRIFG